MTMSRTATSSGREISPSAIAGRPQGEGSADACPRLLGLVPGLPAVLTLCAVFAAALTPAMARALDKHIPPPAPGVESPASRAPQLVRPLGLEDKAFLKELSHRSFRYFWEQADPHTGLVLDRAKTDGMPDDDKHAGAASIAATGFGLTAVCIGAEHRWVTRREARERIRTTLRFFWERAPQEHGWFYHFLDATTGQRKFDSEVSSIDTALLLAGVLTARQAFHNDPQIVRLATQIYERVDFTWMLDGDSLLLSHGWTPEKGFIKFRWDRYSEATILYLLAIGSPIYPISAWSWYAWTRPSTNYDGFAYIEGGPLFINQYSQAYIDFRGRREKLAPHIDYFENAVQATLANRALSLSLSRKFPGYSEDIWGVTASDSPKGYMVWGRTSSPRDLDGTVVPSAPAGSLMFTPEISIPALRTMKEKFGEHTWGRYGFADAFNPNTGWVSPYYLGIDVGITLLSAENLRNGAVWRWFMGNPEAQNALIAVGLEPAEQTSPDQGSASPSASPSSPGTIPKDSTTGESTPVEIGTDH